MTALIEDYAMIGDGETAALVHRNGAIDWLCWPRFDSDACFCALLGDARNGRWMIGPMEAATTSRRYQDDTLVLETRFASPSGAVLVIDFMPLRDGYSSIVRLVVGLEGVMPMRMDLNLRFDYGQISPWIEPQPDGLLARIGPDQVVLRSPVGIAVENHAATALFAVKAGDRLPFVLSYGPSHQAVPPAIDAERTLTETTQFWTDWIRRFDRPTDYPAAVRRSLLTLKALINHPTGGLVAAPTTSLPEKPGGTLNWDYRYCWLRDATFTVSAFLNAGYREEAQAWRDWILRAVAGAPDKIRIMYRVDGGRHLDEWSLDWLPGFRWAQPVRVGNGAATQRQIDIFGEILDVLHLCARAGITPTRQELHLRSEIVAEIERTWRDAGQGLWESRSTPRHYTYSKVMAWVGIDRFLRTSALMEEPLPEPRRAQLEALCDTMHAEICREGFHPGLDHFVTYYGGAELDASLLLLPLVGFLPIDDPRIAATIAAVERDLVQDGLVRRKKAEGSNPEGAFLACSFWLVDCLSMQGRDDSARGIFDTALSVSNDVGLLSEEYDVSGRHLAGNFPQALSHLALVTCALGLSGPVLQRGGG